MQKKLELESHSTLAAMSKDIEQVEVQDFQLLYSGHKMFWRTQDNIDVHVYFHLATDCIEVVPFNGTKELNRLYLGCVHCIAKPFISKSDLMCSLFS